jgi:PAS domain S-box-containing protein
MGNTDSHIEKLELEIELLQGQVKDLKYAEKINQVSFEISNAVNTTDDLNELYKSIHTSLKKILPLPNFFISIVNMEKGWLSFPYHEDFHDVDDVYLPRTLETPSLTKSVITGGKPLFLNKKELEDRGKRKAVCGTVPEVWIGAPLIISGGIIGVIAMYSYNNPDIFTQKNKDLFVSISNQVAMAIDRKHALEKLENNEETFRALTENSNDIIMRYDRSYRHLYVSPAIRHLGFKPDEMIGKTFQELGVFSDLSYKLKKEIEQVFITKKSGRTEFHFLRDKWFDWLLYPEFSQDGEVVAVITSGRDITQRKKLELQRGCLNKINQIVIRATDFDTMLDNSLKEVQKAFQCDRTWIGHFNISTKDLELLNEYSLPKWPGAMAKNKKVHLGTKSMNVLSELAEIREIGVFDQEAVNLLQSKSVGEYNVKSMMLFPVYFEEGTAWLFGIQQCSREKIWTISEQDFFKQIGQRITDGLNNLLLHRKLKDAKNYIDNIMDSMPSVLIGVDNDLAITELNLKAELNAGVLVSEVKGNSLCSVFPDLEPQIENIMKAMKEEKVTGETKIPRQTGGDLCYENVTIYPLIDETVKGAVLRIDDVTEQVKLEGVMIQSEKMLSVGGLAAGMAHEINNPLAGMMQNAQVVVNRLLKDFPANHDAAIEAGITMDAIRDYLSKRKIPEILEHINNAGKNAAEIVKNMLAFSHESTNAKELNNFPELVDKTVELAQHDYNLKKKYDFRNIEIIREYDSKLPNIMCEANMIQQVILNILRNGTEAMFEKFKGQNCEMKPQFIIRLFKDDEMLCVEIEDNGPGMAEDTARRVFDPFFTTKAPDKGTGLGLSVSYFIIVENHAGEMKVESAPEQGSKFVIKLPII